jgi:NitT/TauT family transport system substrate-binding protein
MPLRQRLRPMLWVTGMLAFGALALYGGLRLMGDSAQSTLVYGDNPALPTLTFYTTGFATTPQLPFWAALRDDDILQSCNIRVVLWKSLDDLRGHLLAGKGDLWLGHTEGFAQAHAAGAPVRLLLISGWRKFYVVSRDPAIRLIDDFQGRVLPFAPVGTPAVPVLEALQRPGEDQIDFQPFEPRQLALLLQSGRIDSALVPEPLVTTLLAKDDTLRIVGSVEEWYGRRTGRPGRMPIAGMAVNRHTATRHPELIGRILAAMVAAADRLQADSQPGIAALPAPFETFIAKEMVQRSLERDLVLVRPAAEVREEIGDYLRMLMPEMLAGRGNPLADPAFIWSPP